LFADGCGAGQPGIANEGSWKSWRARARGAAFRRLRLGDRSRPTAAGYRYISLAGQWHSSMVNQWHNGREHKETYWKRYKPDRQGWYSR